MKDIEKLYTSRKREIVFDYEEEEDDDPVQEENPLQEETPTEETTSEYEEMDVEELTPGEASTTPMTYTVDGDVYTWNGREYATVDGNISVGGPVYRKKDGLSNDVIIVIAPEEEEGDPTVLRRMLVTYANGAQFYKYYELKVADNEELLDNNG